MNNCLEISNLDKANHQTLGFDIKYINNLYYLSYYIKNVSDSKVKSIHYRKFDSVDYEFKNTEPLNLETNLDYSLQYNNIAPNITEIDDNNLLIGYVINDSVNKIKYFNEKLNTKTIYDYVGANQPHFLKYKNIYNNFIKTLLFFTSEIVSNNYEKDSILFTEIYSTNNFININNLNNTFTISNNGNINVNNKINIDKDNISLTNLLIKNDDIQTEKI